MGLALSFVPFLDECHRLGVFAGTVLGLGDIKFHEPADRLLAFASEEKLGRFGDDRSVRSFLYDRYGVQDYLDCDMHDRADLKIDLSDECPSALVSRFGVIINAGTLEHIFDQRRAFENVHSMLRPGGVIIHIAPVTWYEHAFYNFNPRLFKDVARANDYSLLAEAFHGPAESSSPGCVFTYQQGRKVSAQAGYSSLIHQRELPSYLLYMAAYRKSGKSESFKVPYDIAETAPAAEGESPT